MTLKSPISGADSQFLFSEQVLGRHQAHYYFDPVAKFIFVDNPTWLEEAYSDAIALMDTGILARNLRNLKFVSNFIDLHVPKFDAGVDLGAGYGIFVRGMRDLGFPFYWSDKYSDNLMARGFEAENKSYDVAVAFEVLEHLLNPLQFLKDVQATYKFDYLIFSATTFDPDHLPSKDWNYWAYETGQHISFFSRDALNWIASKIGMTCHHISNDMYVFCRMNKNNNINTFLRRRFANRARKFLNVLFRNENSKRPSLTGPDSIRLQNDLRDAFKQNPGLRD